MKKIFKIVLIAFIPAVFTAVMINGLYNFAGSSSNFYLFMGIGSPFLVIIFGGLCKIFSFIFKKTGLIA